MADLISQNNGLLTMLQGVLGSTTNATQAQTGTETTQKTADTSALQNIFAKLQGGVTQDEIQAYYQEGAKKVPQLQNSFGDALGMQTRSNMGLATGLDSLNSEILTKIADLNTNRLNSAGNVATQIGNLTSGTTSTVNKTTTNNSTTATDTDKLLPLLGIMAGTSAINGAGGISDLIGKIGKSTGITDAISGLVGGATGSAAPVSQAAAQAIAAGGTAAGAGATISAPVAGGALPVATTLPALGSASEAAALTSNAEAAVASGSVESFLAANPALGPIALMMIGVKFSDPIQNAIGSGVNAVDSGIDSVLSSIFGGGDANYQYSAAEQAAIANLLAGQQGEGA